MFRQQAFDKTQKIYTIKLPARSQSDVPRSIARPKIISVRLFSVCANKQAVKKSIREQKGFDANVLYKMGERGEKSSYAIGLLSRSVRNEVRWEIELLFLI